MGNNLLDFIVSKPEFVLLIIGLLIGKIVKLSRINDGYIPISVILATSVIGYLLLHWDINSAYQGFLAGVSAATGHQTVKQIFRALKNRKISGNSDQNQNRSDHP